MLPLEALGSLDEPEPGYLFNGARTPNSGRANCVLVQIIVASAGASDRAAEGLTPDWTRSSALERRVALVDFCVEIVSIFYCPAIFRLMPHEYADARLGTEVPGGMWTPFGAEPTSGSFIDHVAHVRRCLDFAVECYDDATMSHLGKSMVDAGLLREVYDEPSGRWKIDADGRVLKGLYDVWSQSVTQTQLGWPAECPLDASLVVVWAYLLVIRDQNARAQLVRLFMRRAGRESIMDPGPPIRELNVDGGYLMRLVQGPELPNFIDLYLQMLEQMLSQRSRESVPELRRRAPRPYPDVSDSD